MANLPTVVTKDGLQPQSPAAIRTALLAAVAAVRPGYTANLPGSLVEDISSTDVAAIALCDQARIEAVNSLTPYGANAFLLSQLGQIYIGPGSAPAVPTNTSVSVVFTARDADDNLLPGQVIAVGFTVTDGTYQYVVQDGGVTGADGQTDSLFCLATIPGSWAIPANTVNGLVTSAPSGVVLTLVNPLAGVAGADAETEESYRVRVLRAGQAIAQGMATMLKTLVGEVFGVQQRLVSVIQQVGGGWTIIVGGGDPYKVAYAIFTALFDVSTLVGSTLRVSNITTANPGVVTTDLNHGYETGQTGVVITGVVGMTPINGVALPAITVVDEKTFSIGISTLPYPAYVSGGVVTPNLRNVAININDYPDVYSIPFVNPPQQTVVISLTWNTSADNFVSSAAVAQLGNPALVAYVNAIPVGAPMNLYEMQTVFQEAIASILAPALLTRMVFEVSINGIGVDPSAGTGIIAGDPESYFLTSATEVVITQG